MEELIIQAEKDLLGIYQDLDKIELKNTKKVLEAFQTYKISEAHLNGTTGYGYGDLGREATENIFARVF